MDRAVTNKPRCKVCGAPEGSRVGGDIDWADAKGNVMKTHGKINPETGECRLCKSGREMMEQERQSTVTDIGVFRDRRG